MQPNTKPRDPIALIKRLAIPIGIAMAVLVVFGFVQFLSLLNFRVTGTDPKLSGVSPATPFIKIHFNRMLNSSKLKVEADKDIIDEYHVTDKTLYITTNRLATNTSYRITVPSISSKDGSTLTNLQFDFKTSADEGKLSKEQRSAAFAQQDKKDAPATDPILQYIPHDTFTYELAPMYVAGADRKDRLVIEAQLLIPQDMTAAQEPGVVAQRKDEIAKYLQSSGIDPTKYEFEYVIVRQDFDSGRGTL